MKTVLKIICIFLLFNIFRLNAQNYTINGLVKDAGSGESLIGVTIFVKNTTTGVITNPYGFYSLSLPDGEYNLVISYLGYGIIDTGYRRFFKNIFYKICYVFW